MNIELYIEELILHGFAPGERYRIGEAVERELARLLAGQALPAAWANGGEAAPLDGGAFQVSPGAQPDSIGAQIAQSIYQSFNQ